VKAVVEWPTPQSVKDLRSFLGLARYYRKFVKHFAIIARPLTDLLRKKSIFVWTSEQEVAFQTLKKSLMEAPVLPLPNFAKSFSIETDASSIGVGAVLMQDQHPIAYISKALGSKLQGLSTYEKEYVIVLLAVATLVLPLMTSLMSEKQPPAQMSTQKCSSS
jgi:hypothetical protein